MRTIVPVALAIDYSEPCYSLEELNLPGPDSKGIRRYQILRVVRNDRLAEFKKDMGVNCKAEQFRILGGIRNEATGRIEIFHTVAELQEIADFMRYTPPQHETQTPDLIQGYHDRIEKLRAAKVAQSQFGPNHKTQRS